jgi:2,3-dimethylmalate lyase
VEGDAVKKSTAMRELLNRRGLIVAPAAYDCLSAMIVESLGFPAVFASGFCLAASRMGMPDLGLEDRTLTVDHCTHMAAAVGIPVLVDAGTGYGDGMGAYLTVRELIRAGAAGCFIEDQTSPPVCPLIGPPSVVSVDEFLAKMEAAKTARKDEHDEEFVLVARTDAARTLGLDEAIKRAKAFSQAGADVILLTGGPKEKAALRDVVEAIGAPLWATPGFEHGLTVRDYEEIGTKILSGIEGLFAAAQAVKEVYRELRETGFIKERHYHSSVATPEISKLLKVGKWTELGKRYSRS